jgi:sulfite exporter TauE/SafE
MSQELSVLVFSAASIGFIHTILGPDHYLPFIVMAKSGQWSLRKTTLITFLCGLGHVLSSVILGFIGIGLGIAVTNLEAVESFRGNIAAWGLIFFGLIYFIWGIRQAVLNKPHQHVHIHGDNINHKHEHVHNRDHKHAHVENGKRDVSPWVLFTIFIFGPCEPLIPLLMYPAAKNNLLDVGFVTATFGVVTIATMLTVVLISTLGINLIPTVKIERFTHAIAGGTILFSGLAIQFLGL